MDIKENAKFVIQAAVISSLVLSVWTGIYIYLVFIIAGVFIFYTAFQGVLKLNSVRSKTEINDCKALVDSQSQEDLVEHLQNIGAVHYQMNKSEQDVMVKLAEQRAELISSKTKVEEELQKFRQAHREKLVSLSEKEKDDLVNAKCSELIKKINTETAQAVQLNKVKNDQKLAEMKAKVDRQKQINKEKMNAAVSSTSSELNYARNRYKL